MYLCCSFWASMTPILLAVPTASLQECTSVTSPCGTVVLNTSSDGTLVAGTQRYFLANFARWEKAVSWVFHHKRGSLVDSSYGCSRYWTYGCSLLNCLTNDKLFLVGFSLGIAAKMAPWPFAFLCFGGAASPEVVAESEADALTGSHWAFDNTSVQIWDFMLFVKAACIMGLTCLLVP